MERGRVVGLAAFLKSSPWKMTTLKPRARVQKISSTEMSKDRLVTASHVAFGADPRRTSIPPKKFRDRKSTRLNSSHVAIAYDVSCLKKKRADRKDNDTGQAGRHCPVPRSHE